MDSNLSESLQIDEIPNDLKHHKRYQIVALSQAGIDNKVISEFTDFSQEIVRRWSQRCDINDNPRSGHPLIYDETIQLQTIAFYCQTKPFPDCGRWSLRLAEKHLKTNPNPLGLPESHSTIQRILNKHNLKPHRVKYFLHITDPQFFNKMAPLIELYRNPPKNLFSFDECPGIQILQRLAPDLRTENMKKRLKEYEYIRNGTMDVFAFFQVKTGSVFTKCRSNHTIETLVEVFELHLKTLPENENLHYIMDNLASHASYNLCSLIAEYSKVKCPGEKELNTAQKRRQWLQSEDKRIIFHYTPFHGSWLNMVEIWFSILKEKCLKESFSSPGAIYDAIYAFTDLWCNLLAHPFKWTYDGTGLHQKAVSRFIQIIENSVAAMNVKYMTKQFLLMDNLIKSFQDKVESGTWIRLQEAIKINVLQLHEIIYQDDKPKRQKKAIEALSVLTNSLEIISMTGKKNAA